MFPGVGSVPLGGGHTGQGVRSHLRGKTLVTLPVSHLLYFIPDYFTENMRHESYLERVDARVHPALLDVGDLLSDPEQGVAEAVHLCLVFRLRGLDHQSAGHRPRHGGCVETWTRSSQKNTPSVRFLFSNLKDYLKIK